MKTNHRDRSVKRQETRVGRNPYAKNLKRFGSRRTRRLARTRMVDPDSYLDPVKQETEDLWNWD